MELKKYVYPLRRWWWLLAAATLVAALSSFLVTLQQAPVYQARVTLMMGRAIEDPNPTTSEFWLGQQLAMSYADIANRDVVRAGVKEALGIEWLPPYEARTQENSPLIEIVVSDSNPKLAQSVANELANQLILQTPTSGVNSQQRQAFVQQQLDTLEVQIQETQDQITQKQGELGTMNSARQITDTQNQITALQNKLNTLTSNYSGLLANTQGGAVNTLSIIEPAYLPNTPIGPSRMMTILVASLIGFALAAGAAYLLEYLDDSIKNREDVQRLTGYPILAQMHDDPIMETGRPLMADHPRHPLAEAFRGLRTNLEFAGVDTPLKTILVTSAEPGEGKTSVAANLAIALAQGEKKVILIDGDLRRPMVHEFMGISNEVGLSDVFRGRMSLASVTRLWRNERVAVISSGSLPPNPSELVASQKMEQILASLKDVADLIILDGPPFVVTDAAVLSSKVDGVVVVVRPGYTRQQAVQAMHEQLQRAGAHVLGVVLNRIPEQLAQYYGGGVYYSAYYDNESEDGQPPAQRKRSTVTQRINQSVRGLSSVLRPRAEK